MREGERKGIAIGAEWISPSPSSHHNKKENNKKENNKKENNKKPPNMTTTDINNSNVIFIEIVQLREGIDNVLRDWAEQLEKVGKKKHWVGGERAFGFKVQVQVEQKILRAGHFGAGSGEGGGGGEVDKRGTTGDGVMKD